jgi:hypothetical protein
MPIDNAYTLEEYGERPLLGDVNPNMLMKDLYNPTQLYWLHKYDSATDEELAQLDDDFLAAKRGATLSKEMEYLLSSKRETIRPPLPNPILPEKIRENEKWQDYIAVNTAKDPNFVPTQDVDEIGSILDVENLWFNRDKWYRGYRDTDKYKEDIDRNSNLIPGWIRKRGAEAMDLINWSSGLTPTAFALSKYEAQQDLAEAGYTYEEGAELSERFKSALLPRDKGPEDVETITRGWNIEGPNKGQLGLPRIKRVEPLYSDLGYLLPEAEYLYPGRPEGEKGPIIRYQRNEDGTIEKIFPFNDPGVTGGDYAEYVTREVPALAAELAITKRIMGKQAAKIRYYKKPWAAVKEWGNYAAQTGLAAAAGDFTRALAGAKIYDTEPAFDELFKESALIGAYATGGNAAATAIFKGAVATYRFITGRPPAARFLNAIRELRKDYQIALKKAGLEEGSEGARVLFDDIIGVQPSYIQKQMNEITGESYKLFLGDGKIGPEADFALAVIKLMEKQGIPADKSLETLNNYLLKNESQRLLFAERILLQTGSKEGAQKVAADLGIQLADETIPKQLNKAIATVWDEFQEMIELGIVDEKLLKQMGFDDVAALGVKPATKFLPGELGDEISMSEYIFGKINDPESLLADFKNPVISRLGLMQRRYIKPVQDELNWMLGTDIPDEIITKFGPSPNYFGLSTRLNINSPLSKEVEKIFRGNRSKNFLKEDAAIKEYLIKNVKGDATKIRQTIDMLKGRTKGKFGGKIMTFEELHNAKLLLHDLRKGVGGKMKEPSEKSIYELIGAIEAQQNQMFRNVVKENGEALGRKSGESVEAFMERTRYGHNYWDTLAKFGERSRLANDQGIRALIATGEKYNESLLTTLLKNKEGGRVYHPVATPLFKMLRDSSDDFGFDMIAKFQKGIAAQYKKDVMEPFTSARKKDYKGMKEAHDIWMNKHGGLIKAAFDDTDYLGPAKSKYANLANWDNMNSTQKFVERVIEKRTSALDEIMKKFEPILGAAEDPERMILKIVRGDEFINTSGGIRLRKQLMQIAKRSGDKTLVDQIKLLARKDIYKRIVRPSGEGGSSGLKTIDAEELNRLLTEDFPVTNAAGEQIGASFDRVFGMFLSPDEIKNLRTLNAAMQQETRRQGIAEDVITRSLGQGKSEITIAKLGRLLFGPLNKYTYRFSFRGKQLDQDMNKLLTEAILDPDLASKLIKQMQRKQTAENTIRFFYSLDSTTAHDVGRELRAIAEDEEVTGFQSGATGNPIRSTEYLSLLQEYFRSTEEKQRGTRLGFIPGRETLEQAPKTIAAGLGVAGQKVVDTGANVVNWLRPEAEIIEAVTPDAN